MIINENIGRIEDQHSNLNKMNSKEIKFASYLFKSNYYSKDLCQSDYECVKCEHKGFFKNM